MSAAWLVGSWFADPCDFEYGGCQVVQYYTFTFTADGDVTETRFTCGREDGVYEGAWRADADGEVVLEADDEFNWLGIGVDAVRLSEAAPCYMAAYETQQFEPTTGQIQRGDVCWSTDGECPAGRLQYCEGPPTCPSP